MPEQITIPDTDAIKRDLEYMTARWGELNQAAVFEVRAFKEGAQPQTAKFSPDWIDEAVEWIENLNELGFNIYAVRNPIRHDVSGSAHDSDIIASFFLWADCDDPVAAGNVYHFGGPKWSAAVTTGTIPSPRVHTYWALKEPCTDLAAWRDAQTRIAAHFGSDSSVINPSRIMRVGGTVTYPAKHKVERGYVKEIAKIRTEYAEGRAPVTIEQMLRVFGESAPGASATGIQIATGNFETKTDAHYSDILRRARTDGEKHSGVRDLAASLAGSGVSMQMARAIIAEACPVFDCNVENLIATAYQKFAPAPRDEQFVELSDEEKATIPAALFKPWKRKDLTAIPSPEFVYSDFYARGYTSVTLAAPKVGKSMLGLAEAVDMASGAGILTGAPREKLKVVYYNAEDDQNVIDNRVAALLTEYRLDQSEVEDFLFPQSGVELDNFYMVSGQEGVLNESLFVSIEKFIVENDADVLIFDPLQDLSRSPETNEVFRLLGGRLRRMASTTGVALGLIHHTRKVTPGITPSIDDMRGGSALRGTARFNRILISMTEDEAAQSGVENHKHYMRIGDVESNLAPPSSDINRWFEKVSVRTPSDAYVGAVKPWQWPNAFDDVSKQDAARIRSEIDSMGVPPRADVRSVSWVGYVIGGILDIDADTKSGKAKIKTLVSGWLKTDVLRMVEERDKRAGRDVRVIIAGANNPLIEGGEQ